MGESSDITTPAIKQLNQIPGVYAIRVNSGHVRVKGGYMHLAPNGFPDILAFVRGVGAVGIETKTKSGKVSDAQKTMARRLEAVGVPVYVCRGVEECLRAVRLHLGGDDAR